MYSRDEAKAITDKILNMAKGDAAEVDLNGGERSGTRWANSTITTNLVQYDRSVSVTIYRGMRGGSATTRDFSDAGLQTMVEAANKALDDETVKKRLLELGSVIPGPKDRTPEALGALVKSEIAKWSPVLKPAN